VIAAASRKAAANDRDCVDHADSAQLWSLALSDPLFRRDLERVIDGLIDLLNAFDGDPDIEFNGDEFEWETLA
jgi:hypothetical protein